jgi:hypothetical protein
LDRSAASAVNERDDKPFVVAFRNPFVDLDSLRILAEAHPASLKIKDEEEKFPLQRAADDKRPLEWLVFLFSGHPLNEDRFKAAAKGYLTALLESPPSSSPAEFPPAEQNGFVGFVSDGTLLHDLSVDTPAVEEREEYGDVVQEAKEAVHYDDLQDKLVAFIESSDRCPIETA